MLSSLVPPLLGGAKPHPGALCVRTALYSRRQRAIKSVWQASEVADRMHARARVYCLRSRTPQVGILSGAPSPPY